MLYETCTAHRPPKSPPAATEWPRLLLRDVIWSEREPFRRCRGWCCCMTQQFSVFCPWRPWPLTFDLALQAPQSEGPNTSSMWIWRKSVQRFPIYFIHKQKNTDWRCHKQNLPQFTAWGNKALTCTYTFSHEAPTDLLKYWQQKSENEPYCRIAVASKRSERTFSVAGRPKEEPDANYRDNVDRLCLSMVLKTECYKLIGIYYWRRPCLADYGKTILHLQNRKYLTYSIVVRGGLSHGHG